MHREDCCIIGTVFCEMQLKPNVLAELEEDVRESCDLIGNLLTFIRKKNISIPEVKTSYHGQNDVIVLEDETGRVILDGPLVLEEPLCTGTFSFYGTCAFNLTISRCCHGCQRT